MSDSSDQKGGREGTDYGVELVRAPAVWLSRLVAFAVAGGGVARIFLCKDFDSRLGNVTLTYFIVAAALLMLPYIKSIAIGETKIELQQLTRRVKQLAEKSADLEIRTEQATDLSKAAEQATRTVPPGSGNAVEDGSMLRLKQAAEAIQPGPYEDDPWKGQFGNHSASNGRVLAASVREIIGDKGYYLVRLQVESTDRSKPLNGYVQFFLHSTFPNSRRLIRVIDGKADLSLRAWGAFTVGAIADEGSTRLELDLAADPSFPEEFRKR